MGSCGSAELLGQFLGRLKASRGLPVGALIDFHLNIMHASVVTSFRPDLNGIRFTPCALENRRDLVQVLEFGGMSLRVPAAGINGIMAGSPLQEKLHHLRVTGARSAHQRGKRAGIPTVDIRPHVHEQAYHVQMASLGRSMRGVTPSTSI